MQLYSSRLTIDCRYYHPFKDQLEDVTEGSDLRGASWSQFLQLLAGPNEAAETAVLT